MWGTVILPYSTTFCEALQYWIRGSRVLYTIHIHWHFVGSWVAHCAPVEKAIDGLSISLWTDTILQHRESICYTSCSCVQPMGELCTQLCRFTQGEKVVKMLLIHLFCSRLDQEGRQTRRGGGYLLHSWTPKCHGGGSMLLPWKPSLSNIWFWSAARLRWDPSHLLSALQVTGFSKLGINLEHIVVTELLWPLGLVLTLVIIGLGKRERYLHDFSYPLHIEFFSVYKFVLSISPSWNTSSQHKDPALNT